MSSVTPLAAALIGAGGATFGAAVSTGGQVLIEWRRTLSARAAAREQENRAMRLAVRLVIEELAECAAMIQNAAQTRRFWVGPRELPVEVWAEYRVRIAAGTELTSDWHFVTSAYDAVVDLNWAVDHHRNTDQEVNLPVVGAQVRSTDGTRETWRRIRAAVRALERIGEIDTSASRVGSDDQKSEVRFWPFGDDSDFDLEGAMLAEEEAQYEEDARRASEGR